MGVCTAKMPQTCNLSILPACCNLSTSCNKVVNFIKLQRTSQLKSGLKQCAASLWIASFGNQFATSYLKTCNRLMSRQAVLRHANTQMIHLNEYHYMLNNKNLLFRYHKFLDVDSNKVERTIEG